MAQNNLCAIGWFIAAMIYIGAICDPSWHLIYAGDIFVLTFYMLFLVIFFQIRGDLEDLRCNNACILYANAANSSIDKIIRYSKVYHMVLTPVILLLFITTSDRYKYE